MYGNPIVQNNAGFSEPSYFPEMYLDPQNFYIPTFNFRIRIQKINKIGPELLENWVHIAVEGFGLASNEVRNFINSTLNLQRQCIYIALAVLYSSQMAVPLYGSIGFRTLGEYCECSFYPSGI